MHRIKIWLRHYFGFTARESNGFIVVMFLFFMILTAPAVYSILQRDNEPIKAKIEVLKADSIRHHFKSDNSKFTEEILFEFDPNTISESDLIKLGIKDYVARRVINYRNKGGKFRKKEDFGRIYGLNPDIFEKLIPYIVISLAPVLNNKVKPDNYKRHEHTPTVYKIVEINSTDTADLLKVNGIGHVLAGRIIKYRDKLGGFAVPEQLYEVYGLDSQVVEKVLKSFILNNTNIKKLNINALPADSLVQHPYIGKKAAKILVNYRIHHGNYKSLNDLINSKALDLDKLNKLLPYLEF